MNSSESVEERVSKIGADQAGALELSEVLLNTYGGPGPLEADAPVLVRSLISLLRRRPDFSPRPPRELLNRLAIEAWAGNELSARLICEEIQQEVSASINLWRDWAGAMSESDTDRTEALRVLSYCDPQTAQTQESAVALMRTIPPHSDVWYLAFDAARRILGGTAEWPRLLEFLAERAKTESIAENVNPPLPHPEVSILVSLLPYREAKGPIYDRLDRWHPLEAMEDLRHLPPDIQGELLSRIVSKMNEKHQWVAGGGFYPIYLLLQNVIFRTSGDGEYTAEAGRVIYQAKRIPGQTAALTVESVAALEPILGCQRLWEVDTNLLDIFGLPNKREELAAWICENSGKERPLPPTDVEDK